MFQKKTNRNGFTLVELLVVIAVILILVSVSILTLPGYVKKAKAAVCASNCNLLERELVVPCVMDDALQKQTALNQKRLQVSEQETANLCPDHGAITVYYDAKASTVHVYCDQHAPFSVSLGEGDVQGVLSAAMQTLPSKVSFIDYGALSDPNSKATEVIQALEQSGLKMSDIRINGDAVTAWCAANVGAGQANQVYFTACDLSKVAAGTKVPVIMYICSTNTFRVYDAAVKTAVNSKGETYKTLDRTNMDTLKWNPANYEEAETAYLSSPFFR